jgi:hypothetical protein
LGCDLRRGARIRFAGVAWHGKMAYTRALVTIPATGFHQRYPFAQTSLLPTGGGGAPPPAPSSPPAPGPVSSQASLSSTCTMGYEPPYGDGSGNVGGYGPFVPGTPPASITIGGQRYSTTAAYQVSFTNTGSATAEVNGFAVAFYDASGTELGSDQQPTSNTFITAGQTLRWDVFSGTDAAGYGLYGNGGTGIQSSSIPAGDATCQVVQWYHP